MRVIVEAPARLHLGFLDLNGECGRVFGSLGVAVERPRWVLEACPAPRPKADGDAAPEILATLARLREHADGGSAAAVRTVESIPRHAGLGSGTQLELSVALAASRVRGEAPSVRELAARLGRGKRSGIGIAVFERGGFVVDAGRPTARESQALREEPVPPVIFQQPLPDDWFFVIVTPQRVQGLHGPREDSVFRDLRPMSEDRVGRICRLTLMKIVPAVLTDDIEGFGEAITEIQVLVGEHFAAHQGGVYATATGRDAARFALEHGAHGVGQSSWGPTVFALVRGESSAAGLASELQAFLGDDSRVSYTGARNRGAGCRIEP